VNPLEAQGMTNPLARRTTLGGHIGAWLARTGIVVWIVVLGLFLTILTPRFLTIPNLLIILTQSSIIAIMAVGMTFVIISAGIDLSVGSIAGFSSITMGMLIVSETMYRDPAALLNLGRDPWVLGRSILGAMIAAALCGCVNGILIAYAGLPPFIATLGMMGVARGVAAYVSAGYPAYGLPDPIKFLGQGKIGGLPMPIIIMVLIALLGHLLLAYTTFGARVFAVGGNRDSAFFSGINVKRTLLLIYTLNGFLAGIGAIVLSGRANLAHPDIGLGFELFVVGAVVMGGTSLMGGKGGVVGSVLGAVLMAEVQNGINLLDVPVNLMQPILGAVIVLAVFWDQMQKRRKSGG
jgi:ribose transport system permease protein